MKNHNVRIDSPVYRLKSEFTTSTSAQPITVESLLSDNIGKIKAYFDIPNSDGIRGLNVRVKSITLRANEVADISVLTNPIEVLGRQVYPVFKSNSLIASVSTEGHVFGM